MHKTIKTELKLVLVTLHWIRLRSGARGATHNAPHWTYDSSTHWRAKNATQGNRRSWVSTNTFWTNTLGSQLCC